MVASSFSLNSNGLLRFTAFASRVQTGPYTYPSWLAIRAKLSYGHKLVSSNPVTSLDRFCRDVAPDLQRSPKLRGLIQSMQVGIHRNLSKSMQRMSLSYC